MAATAQNHMEPLRSLEDKKDEDRDEERALTLGMHTMSVVWA